MGLKRLIVCNNELKKELLKSSNDLDILYITLENLITSLTFKTSDKTIHQLMMHFSLDYNVCKSYVDNFLLTSLLTIDNVNNLNEFDKMKYYNTLPFYEYARDNNLLIYDELFKIKVQDMKIKIIGYPYILKEYLLVLKDYDVTIEKEDLLEDKKPRYIYKCNSLEEELFIVLEDICSLLKNDIPLSNIKLAFSDVKNISLVKKMFNYYHIPINLNTEESIYHYPLINEIVNNYDIFDSTQLNSILDNINDNSIDLIKNFIEVINDCDLDNDEISKTILENKIKNKKIKTSVVYKDAVSLVNINNINTTIRDNDYLYIVGFNDGKVPVYKKDEDYYKDSFKSICGFSSSSEINSYCNDYLRRLIHNDKVFITYSIVNEEVDFPSSILNEIDIIPTFMGKTYSDYADDYNKYLLNKYLDLIIQYNKFTPGWDLLYNTYFDELKSKNLTYSSYSNSFTGLSKTNILNLYPNEIKLSYTSLNTYNKCAFAYYIERVLKIEVFEETFVLFIGKLYHEVLKNIYNEDFDFESCYNNYILNSGYELSIKEKFLLIRLKEELKKTIEVLYKQKEYITYDNSLYEKDILVEMNDGKRKFDGKLDKIYFKEVINEETKEIETYVCIIDYKTGKAVIDLNLVEYGLSMQLVIYIYLMKKQLELKNVKIGGIFLQPILKDNIKAKRNNEDIMKEEYDKLYSENMKLVGYLVNDNNNFDSSMEESKLIKSLRFKDGKYIGYSKVLDLKEIENLYQETTKQIEKCFINIENGHFEINPKLINNDDESCAFCKFNDLCYKTYKDYRKINTKEGNLNG